MHLNYQISGHFENFIDDQVKKGHYGDAGAVISDALRLLEEREITAELNKIKAKIQAGLDSKVTIPAQEVLTRLSEKYSNMLEN